MSHRSTFFRTFVAWLAIGAVGSVGVARAGTTGRLSGVVVVTGTTTPIADARVSVVSPSESLASHTDGGGHFSFVSLPPDTYTVSVEKSGYEPVAVAGISVFADATQNVTLSMRTALREIGRVTARSSSASGQAGHDRRRLLRRAASSRIASTRSAAAAGSTARTRRSRACRARTCRRTRPATTQTVHIRGGDVDQVGYEFDGIPVNRAFDNYPSGSASSLGQLELQVYTGASPADVGGPRSRRLHQPGHPQRHISRLSDAQRRHRRPDVLSQRSTSKSAARRRTGTSRTTSASAASTRATATSTSSTARLTPNEFGPIMTTCPAKVRSSTLAVVLHQRQTERRAYASNGIYGPGGYMLGPLDYGNLALPRSPLARPSSTCISASRTRTRARRRHPGALRQRRRSSRRSSVRQTTRSRTT